MNYSIQNLVILRVHIGEISWMLFLWCCVYGTWLCIISGCNFTGCTLLLWSSCKARFLEIQDYTVSAKEANKTLLKRAMLKRAVSPEPVSQNQGFYPFTLDLLDHDGILWQVWDLPHEQDIDQRDTRMIRYWITCCGMRNWGNGIFWTWKRNSFRTTLLQPVNNYKKV